MNLNPTFAPPLNPLLVIGGYKRVQAPCQNMRKRLKWNRFGGAGLDRWADRSDYNSTNLINQRVDIYSWLKIILMKTTELVVTLLIVLLRKR